MNLKEQLAYVEAQIVDVTHAGLLGLLPALQSLRDSLLAQLPKVVETAVASIPGVGAFAPVLNPIIEALAAQLAHTAQQHATPAQAEALSVHSAKLDALAQQIAQAAQAAAQPVAQPKGWQRPNPGSESD